MIHLAVAFAVLAHVLFWGAGLAMLAMPGRWRRFWPVLVAPAGVALQSAVVWFGAVAGLKGANSYAWWSEAVPLGLLVGALWHRALRPRAGLPGAVQAAWVDVQRVGLVWIASLGVLVLLVVPLAWASKGLTTISLASCDAGDYAAGARVLQEFASTERGGFLGLTEVVRVQSVDNFFDYWTRLNHFTPSALIAFNGAVLGCEAHELTSLLTMVLLAGSVPVVFWMARALIGFSGGPSVAIAALYGLSPLTWYAVGHVAPGQLLAAMAVALVTWTGVAMWRAPLTWKSGTGFAGVLAVGYWIVLGSYNFFIVLCLVPAVAYAGGAALLGGQWARLVKWAVVMLAPLAACAVIFAGRVAGLIERFQLLRTYDFGWKIPALTPEGWLGIMSGPELEPWRFAGIRWVLAAAVAGLLAWAATRAWRERRKKGWTAAAVTLPVLAGYAFLQWRGATLGTNASYDAFKLFAVFYPVMLPAFCWWVSLRWSGLIREWFLVMSVAGVVVAGNLLGTGMVFWRMCAAPLIVDGELRQLRKIEAMPEVRSVNVLLPDMWSRLWANAFLLKKPQYFLTDTYEGRWHSSPKGEWNLEGGLLAVTSAEAGANVRLSPRYALTRAASVAGVKAELGGGWNAEEFATGSGAHWRWATRKAEILVENSRSEVQRVELVIEAHAVTPGELVVKRGGVEIGRVKVGAQRGAVRVEGVELAPGKTTLSLESGGSGVTSVANDARELGICLWRAEIVLPAAVR